MGMATLRQFLQSLCCNSPWNYAVFWRLQHQCQMLLLWEDGYCEIPGLRESTESILNDIYSNGSDVFSSLNCESSTCNGNLGDYSVGLAVAKMSSVHYALGEGLIGEVAYTGNHCWIISDNISAGDTSPEVIPKFPDEWLIQFVAGIKTILLVPVLPHGVLQLGSLDKVAEDPVLVAYIKDKFNAHKHFVECFIPFVSNEDFLVDSFSLMPMPVGNLDDLPAHVMNDKKSEDVKAFFDSVEATELTFSNVNQMTPPCVVQDSCQISRKDMMEIVDSSTETDIDIQSMNVTEILEHLYPPMNCDKPGMMGSDIFEFSCMEEESEAFSYSCNKNMGITIDYADKTMNFYSGGVMMEQPFVGKHADHLGHTNEVSFLSFPRDSELHEALGPTFMGLNNRCMLGSSVPNEDAWSGSTLIRVNEPSAWESIGLLPKGDDAGYLLEAVVSGAYGGPDADSVGWPNSRKSVCSHGHCAASFKGQTERSVSVIEDTVQHSCVTSEFGGKSRNAAIDTSPSASSFGRKLLTGGKRRTRSGDSQRRRPRDRQLIQDCVKELRDLVPNGAKCSIDSLLDRTVKHMLFLRSVADQTDKLKRLDYQEVADPDKSKPPEARGNHQNGASWAFELGSEWHICPIIVKDLDYPGHMKIEMLCSDFGRFMQIADAIHRLELTILKGVMERHTIDMWAHFIVEVPRGFHRLNIFWPLMQLLQQTGSTV